MLFPYIFAGFVLFVATRSKPQRRVSPPSNKGIIFNCSYIEIVDKKKFYENLKKDLKDYLEREEWKIDFLNIYAEMIKKYNFACYKKILARKLNSKEKIALLLFIAELSDILHQLVWGIEYNPNTVEYKEYIAKLVNSEAPMVEWLGAGEEYPAFESALDSFRKNFKYPV